MKREIKFRGKRSDNTQWIYGSLMQYNDGSFYIGKNDETWTDDGFHDYYFDEVALVNEDTIGQFTGLKDKNGKEIYEGDIIRSYDSENNPIIHSISWDNQKVCYVATMLQYPLLGGSVDKSWIDEFEKEVIGNIHDNQELLKTE